MSRVFVKFRNFGKKSAQTPRRFSKNSKSFSKNSFGGIQFLRTGWKFLCQKSEKKTLLGRRPKDEKLYIQTFPQNVPLEAWLAVVTNLSKVYRLISGNKIRLPKNFFPKWSFLKKSSSGNVKLILAKLAGIFRQVSKFRKKFCSNSEDIFKKLKKFLEKQFRRNTVFTNRLEVFVPKFRKKTLLRRRTKDQKLSLQIFPQNVPLEAWLSVVTNLSKSVRLLSGKKSNSENHIPMFVKKSNLREEILWKPRMLS